MIVSCPQCNTSFEVPTDILLPDGKKVKCTKCGHVWFQEPDEQAEVLPEAAEAEELDSKAEEQAEETPPVEEEPESFDIGFVEEPNAETSEDTHEPKSKSKASVCPDNKLTNLIKDKPAILAGAAGVVLFIVILLFLVILRGPIVNAWPAFDSFYKGIGLGYSIKQDNLAINNLRAQIEIDQKTLTVSGDLVNLSSKPSRVLPLMAVQLDETGSVLKEWVIKPPIEELAPAQVVKFESQYPLEELATQVDIGFSLYAKKVLKVEAKTAGSAQE